MYKNNLSTSTTSRAVKIYKTKVYKKKKMSCGFSNYFMAASTYALLRKPIVLKNHTIETYDSDYKDKKYRPLLTTEVASMTILNTVFGPFFSPFFVAKDLHSLEISLRGLDIQEYYGDTYYRSRSMMDLMFV